MKVFWSKCRYLMLLLDFLKSWVNQEKQKIMHCASCEIGKKMKFPYKGSSHTCKKPLDRWHMDITGTKQVVLWVELNMCVVLVYELTEMMLTIFLKSALIWTIAFCRILFKSETGPNEKSKNLRSDNAGESISKKIWYSRSSLWRDSQKFLWTQSQYWEMYRNIVWAYTCDSRRFQITKKFSSQSVLRTLGREPWSESRANALSTIVGRKPDVSH